MNSDSKKELGVGIFFLVLSVAYMIGTTTISTFTPFGNRGLDSRSVPLLIGLLAGILSSIQIITILVKEHKMKMTSSADPVDEVQEVCDPDEVACVDTPKGTVIQRIDSILPVKLILSLLFLMIYIVAYQKVGFILSSIFFLMSESLLLVKDEERKKWRTFIILFSIGASVVIYFVFTKYLSLFLPKGILG
ncbi:tripartite tricarboxylate transporter TctB family protein [Pleomorphochaeta sp. DL1XJH-081]|uniref:tripartite tricarboxylate transporter TctB family protein n=1 Tax=Pleomorphochaeta sp. DL1XJH-081 TaxID=3409690 RepID=UPI003BB7B92C